MTPPTPSNPGAADGDAPAAVTRGASALREFLARESHALGSRADPRAFADWLEDETFARIRSDEAFALRAYASGLRRRHAHLLDPLLAAVADAEAAYDASDDAARIRTAATDVERANAAVAGIRRFLDDTPLAETEATTTTTTAKNDAKRLATRAKLDAFLARLPLAERHLDDLRASSELHRARADARAALAEAREAVGLTDAESAAAEASRVSGGDVVAKGESFETTCEAIVRDLLRRDPNAFRSSSLDGEDGELWLLRNVTLGMAAGEIDLAVVRARRDDPSAFVDAIPRDGDGVRRRAGDDTVREGTGTAIEGAGGVSGSDPESAPAVDVLAVVECKRNPDDVARGFHARQITLGWLAGSNYDPEDWRNKRHPTGHFARGFHPVRLATRVGVTGEDAAAAAKERFGEDGSAFALTRQSFRRFRGSDADGGGFFLRGLWFITRARTMTGMDAKIRAPLLEMAATRVAARLFEDLGEVPTRDAFVAAAATWRDERRGRGTESGASETNDHLRRDLERMREWAERAGEEVPHPSDTRGVLEMYLKAEGEDVPGQVVFVRSRV